jgi:2-phospho-L-lactate guanylyltransferase
MTSETATPRICAIVPVKRFEAAKSRLAGILEPDERAALAQAMFTDVMTSLHQARRLASVLVVTTDLIATRIAAEFGAETLPDPAEQGTNSAVAKGIRWAKEAGYDGALVVPADIPFVASTEIDDAIDAMGPGRVVLVPAMRDQGTNLLGLMPPDGLETAFGVESFKLHLAAAVACDLNPVVLPLAGATRDIDVPADLWFPDPSRPATFTAALLPKLLHLETGP